MPRRRSAPVEALEPETTAEELEAAPPSPTREQSARRRGGGPRSQRPSFLGKRVRTAAKEGVQALTASASRSLVGIPQPMTNDEADSIVQPAGRMLGRHLKVSGKLPPDAEDGLEIVLTILLWILAIFKTAMDLRTEQMRAANIAQMRRQEAARRVPFGAAPEPAAEAEPGEFDEFAPAPMEAAPRTASMGAGATGAGQVLGDGLVAAGPEAYALMLERMPGDTGLAAVGA